MVLTMVPVGDVPTPPLRETLRDRALVRLLSYQPRTIAFVGSMALLLALVSPTPMRVALLLGPLGVVALVGRYERWRPAPTSALRSQAFTLLTGAAQLLVVLGAGGIAGPLGAATLITAVLLGLLLPPRRALGFVIGVQVPALWGFAWIQHAGVAPSLVPAAHAGLWAAPGTPGSGPFLGATVWSLALFAAATFARTVRDVLESLVEELLAQRDAVLAEHAESARAMSAMSIEIAHELKNPLASVKGLAALVRRDLDGRALEQMDVLTREVRRMETILEEFLGFSRPLVPLSPERTWLEALTRDVVSLHEGLASERGVALAGPTEGRTELSCDPQKVRQILVNLVQNAIDASLRGGEITLSVTRTVDGAEVAVTDRGRGLDPAIRARLFMIGATTKASGHGIGLAVARALARQHGGDLTLEDDPRGGAVARLALPARAVEGAPRAATSGGPA